jgi:hypothetical protein
VLDRGVERLVGRVVIATTSCPVRRSEAARASTSRRWWSHSKIRIRYPRWVYGASWYMAVVIVEAGRHGAYRRSTTPLWKDIRVLGLGGPVSAVTLLT